MPADGYAWWYLDALSDDGRHGVSIIAFIGSVFSPYYALRRRRAPSGANPCDHVAMNVALYGANGYRWAMTERGERALSRSADRLAIGPSQISRSSDGSFVIEIDEIAVPIPRRIRGRLHIRPQTVNELAFAIHPSGRHIWQPISPYASIEAEWTSPRLSWTGSAYLDHNRGTEPLEKAFHGWSWSRSHEPGRTRIFYDTLPLEGTPGRLHLEYGADGLAREIEAPPLANYGRSLWRLPVAARSETGTTPEVLERWEDGPFYARTLISHRLGEQHVRSVHETLSLDRFKRPIVQAMLPFRMPRRW